MILQHTPSLETVATDSNGLYCYILDISASANYAGKHMKVMLNSMLYTSFAFE